MGDGNWIVENLRNALAMWNAKLTEIWALMSQSPDEFKGGAVWDVMVNINDALKAIGYGLLVLFFVMGVMKTAGSFAELKRPEHAFKVFIRFALAEAAITFCMDILLMLFRIAQGAISVIMSSSGIMPSAATDLPQEVITAITNVGFWDSIPLWIVTLLGSLIIFQNIHGHRYRADPTLGLCRGAHCQYRQIVSQNIRRPVLAGLRDRAGLCDILRGGVRGTHPRQCGRDVRRHHHMAVHWRVIVQYAGAGGNHQDQRQADPGAHGLKLIRRQKTA